MQKVKFFRHEICVAFQLCTKGLCHIKKYLFIQALKEDRKRGLLSEVQLRKNYRKSGVTQNGLVLSLFIRRFCVFIV